MPELAALSMQKNDDSYRAVAFDLDGVITDSEPVWAQRADDFLARHGKRLSEADRDELYGASKMRGMEILARVLGRDVDEVTSEAERFYEEWPVDYRAMLIDGARETVAWLHEAGVPVALATSGYEYRVREVIEAYDFGELFDAYVAGDTVEHPKPAPDIYLASAAALGVRPGELVAVEDSRYGVEAAHAAGVAAVQFNRTGAERLPHTVAECHDYDEVRRALRELLVVDLSRA
jgi:HAD superfamily hydrolase (TIGR01509 family)